MTQTSPLETTPIPPIRKNTDSQLEDLELYRSLFNEAVKENAELLEKLKIITEQNTQMIEELQNLSKEVEAVRWESRANHKKNHSKRLWDNLLASNDNLGALKNHFDELSRVVYGLDENSPHPYTAIVKKVDLLIENNEKLLLATEQ